MIADKILKINYISEVISARKIAYHIEDKLFCKVKHYQISQKKFSLVEQQQENMRN